VSPNAGSVANTAATSWHMWKPDAMNPGIAVGVGVGIVYFVGLLWWSARRARRNSRRWIASQLLASKSPVQVSVRYSGGTWKPARNDPETRFYARGNAIYSLDDEGIVHLLVQSRDGSEHRFSGPMPKVEPTQSPESSRMRHIARGVIVGYVVVGATGFVVGYALASGSQGGRLAWGLLGLFIVMLVVWLAMLVVRIAMSVSKLRKGNP
jgi:hypothetical protein